VGDEQRNDDSKPLTDIQLERLKMYQDSFKPMMTFSSGAIVLASAVTGALFEEPDRGWLLASSISLLAVSALAAMLGLLFVSRRIDRAVDPSIGASFVPLRHALWVSVIPAYSGLALFSIFAGLNVTP
jgi:hypothetical protein